jgi:hypothetical protein
VAAPSAPRLNDIKMPRVPGWPYVLSQISI